MSDKDDIVLICGKGADPYQKIRGVDTPYPTDIKVAESVINELEKDDENRMKHFFSIIGGMGTIATESYVRLINHRVKITKDQDYLNYILVNDAQIPDRTAYIMDHSKPNFFYDLKDDVLSQSKLNPDFFVMPCNTAHYFYNDLAALTDVPFLHMMRIAVHKFVDDFPKEEKIGLIATEGSIYDHLYVDELERVGKKLN